MKRIAEDAAKGKLDNRVKFRKGDELHDLADSLNEMFDGIREMVAEDRDMIEQIRGLSAKLKKDSAGSKDLKKGVKETIMELDKLAARLKKAVKKYKLN